MGNTAKEKNQKDYQKVLDKKTNYQGILKNIVTYIAILMAIFHLYTGNFGLLVALKQRSLHLLFGFVLIFFLYPTFKPKEEVTSKINIIDIVLIGLSVVCFGYMFIFESQIMLRPALPNAYDLIIGGVCILLVLEATRRVVGSALPILAVIFLLYAYYGQYFPGFFFHRGFSLKRIIDHIYVTTNGIFGIPIAVSASFVFLFILLGSFLAKSGLSQAFIDLAIALTGKTSGGPAKVAVLASGFMGSISGSSIANVVSTGAFTIPLMKRVGYNKEFSGAVEAAASTGGQIMPPVMGAAAFIMAEILGIEYLKIVYAAVIPAIIYFFSVGVMVHLRAKKQNLKGMTKTPDIKLLLRTKLFLFIPIIVMVYFLVAGYTPLKSAVMAIVSSIITGFFNKMRIKDFFEALEEASYHSVSVVSACATAGIIIGVVTLTGIGNKAAHMIVYIAGGNLFFTVFFTMIASFILGMGLPTTAKYVILATVAAPALTNLGVNPLAAHMVILYFGIFADVTPPVAVAAYAAAAISGGNAMKTGLYAFRLAFAGFIVPYIFIFNPGLLGIDTSFGCIIILIFTTIIGVVCLGVTFEGYFLTTTRWYERIIFAIIAALTIDPNIYTDIIGGILLAIVLTLQYLRIKIKKTYL